MKNRLNSFEQLLKYFKLNKKDIIDANKNDILKNKRRKHPHKNPDEIIYFKCSVCKKIRIWSKFRFRKEGINDLDLICRDCYKNV